MIFAIDFDGTCTTHDFPKVGKEIGAPRVLKRMVENGHQLILWTMRCDEHTSTEKIDDDSVENLNGQFLTDAVNWFKENDIPLWGIQRNKTHGKWSRSSKAYAHTYIAALGCPLKWSLDLSNRPFVDWVQVENILEKRCLLDTPLPDGEFS